MAISFSKVGFEYYLTMLRRHLLFSFSRWGDGEWNAVLGRKGEQHTNCDKSHYFKGLGNDLKEVLMTNPTQYSNYFIAMQNLAIRQMRSHIESFIETAPGLSHVEWHQADTFHHRSAGAELYRLVDALQEYRVVLVGPQHLQNLDSLLREKAHVVTPKVDVYLSIDDVYDKIHREVSELLRQDSRVGPNSTVAVLLSAGMAAKILVDRLYRGYKGRLGFGNRVTLLDLGSVWDPYCGVQSRGYHGAIDPSWLQPQPEWWAMINAPEHAREYGGHRGCTKYADATDLSQQLPLASLCGLKILDAGASEPGFYRDIRNQQPLRLDVVDVTESCRDRVGDSVSNVYTYNSLPHIEVPEEGYDLILFRDVSRYTLPSQLQSQLRQLVKSLSPGGRLFATFRVRDTEAEPPTVKEAREGVIAYTKEAIRDVFAKATDLDESGLSHQLLLRRPRSSEIVAEFTLPPTATSERTLRHAWYRHQRQTPAELPVIEAAVANWLGQDKTKPSRAVGAPTSWEHRWYTQQGLETTEQYAAAWFEPATIESQIKEQVDTLILFDILPLYSSQELEQLLPKLPKLTRRLGAIVCFQTASPRSFNGQLVMLSPLPPRTWQLLFAHKAGWSNCDIAAVEETAQGWYAFLTME